MNKNITILLSPYKGISWKKILRNWLIIFTILGALTIYGAYALNSKDLIEFYAFENTGNQTGSKAGYLLESNTTTIWNPGTLMDSVAPTSGNALYFSSDTYNTRLKTMYFPNWTNGSSGFSVNVWVYKSAGWTNDQYLLRFGQSDSHFLRFWAETPYTTFLVDNQTAQRYWSHYQNVTYLGWHMYTLTYNPTGTNWSIYYDNVLLNTSSFALPSITGHYLELGQLKYTGLDDLSFWNKTLSTADINALYADSLGLGYTDTVNYENFTHEINTCYGSYLCLDGFFDNDSHFQCLSTELCGSLGCVGNVAQEFITDGQAYCANAVVSYVYDICMRNQNIICKNMTLNSLLYFGQNYTSWDRSTESCPTFIDGNFNKVACGIQCIDNYTYYHDTLKGDPPGMNFTAYCGNGTNQCPNPGVFRCYSDQVVEQCQIGNDSYYYWNHYGDCAQNYVCRQGQCLYNGAINGTSTSDVPLGTQTQGNNDLWNGFFGIDTSTSTGKLLCALVAIAIFTLALTGVMIGISSASGVQTPIILNVGIVGSGFIMSTLYFIAIGFIPFWILLITICIIGLGLGSWFVKKPMPGG